MPTYRLGPASTTQDSSSPPRRPLVCECCFEALGIVRSANDYAGISADLVIASWPEIQGAVVRHERLCPPRMEG